MTFAHSCGDGAIRLEQNGIVVVQARVQRAARQRRGRDDLRPCQARRVFLEPFYAEQFFADGLVAVPRRSGGRTDKVRRRNGPTREFEMSVTPHYALGGLLPLGYFTNPAAMSGSAQTNGQVRIESGSEMQPSDLLISAEALQARRWVRNLRVEMAAFDELAKLLLTTRIAPCSASWILCCACTALAAWALACCDPVATAIRISFGGSEWRVGSSPRRRNAGQFQPVRAVPGHRHGHRPGAP